MSNEQLPNNNLTQNINEGINPPTSPTQPITQNNKASQPSSPRRFKILKIILGIATLSPIFFLIAGLLLFYKASLNNPFAIIGLLGFFLFITILNSILLFIYIIILFKNIKISKYKKILWALVFSLGIIPLLSIIFSPALNTAMSKSENNIFMIFMVGLSFIPIIVMPIYWRRYIMEEL